MENESVKVHWQGCEGKHIFRKEKPQTPSQPHDYKTDNKIILNAYIWKI